MPKATINEEVKNVLEVLTESIESIARVTLKENGEVSSDCQLIGVINAVKEVGKIINGIRDEDVRSSAEAYLSKNELEGHYDIKSCLIYDEDSVIDELGNAYDALKSASTKLTQKMAEICTDTENEEKKENETTIEEIAGHTVSWWVDKVFDATIGELVSVKELDDASIEHLKSMLTDGYREGELCVSYYPGNNESVEPIELRGWWHKQG
ncbi:hypothetical protein A3715_33425 [Oleiphilus sp. HI0009]|nr:hypothetical protein A3715_10225 [Oleiphilus sp. HI0009]KZX82746.1 hypothetical protein A3715_33425 [Oleiphilus sp. HI0009]